MPESNPPRLELVSREGQHYIIVPCHWAEPLRIYLRSRGVLSAPPQGSTRGFSSVTLGKKTNAPAVQGFLDRWANCG